MTAKLNSYLHFNGNAKEAMDFYKSVFGGEVQATTFGEYVNQGEMPVAEADKGKIMHSFLEGSTGIELMGSDTPSSMQFQTGTQITLSLSGDDETQLNDYWGKLSEGATITVPLAKSPWGDTFGMLTDKFDIEWMVNIGSVQGKA